MGASSARACWRPKAAGPPNDRYRSFYYRDATGSPQEITFTHKGLVVRPRFSAERTAGGTTLTSLFEPGSLADFGIRKRLVIPSDRLMRWTDDFQTGVASGWEPVIDASWIRIAGPDPARRTMAIDDTLFVGSGPGLRPVTVERAMAATPERVWEAWTGEAGWQAAYAPDRPEPRAHIELAIGGQYEWLFDGVLGCNGCQVLSYLPGRMLSFSWNAPVAQPRSRVRRTWVVVEIEPAAGGGSRVSLTQLGFGTGPHWDETRDYFERAWAAVLARMADGLR